MRQYMWFISPKPHLACRVAPKGSCCVFTQIVVLRKVWLFSGCALILCWRSLGQWVRIWLSSCLTLSQNISYVGKKMRISPVTCYEVIYRKIELRNWLGVSGEMNLNVGHHRLPSHDASRSTCLQLKAEACLEPGLTWGWGRKGGESCFGLLGPGEASRPLLGLKGKGQPSPSIGWTWTLFMTVSAKSFCWISNSVQGTHPNESREEWLTCHHIYHDRNYICVNSALARCLLCAAFKATGHRPRFPLDRLPGFLGAFQQLSTKHIRPQPVSRGHLKVRLSR